MQNKRTKSSDIKRVLQRIYNKSVVQFFGGAMDMYSDHEFDWKPRKADWMRLTESMTYPEVGLALYMVMKKAARLRKKEFHEHESLLEREIRAAIRKALDKIQ